MKTKVQNGAILNGMKVRRSQKHPGYWDVIPPYRDRASFTGTLTEIRAIRWKKLLVK